MENRSETLALGFFASLAAGAAIYILTKEAVMKLSALVDPQAVAPIAATLPQDESTFIDAALQWVKDKIEYEDASSELNFHDSSVNCNGCFTPLQTLRRARGNCLSQSNLLTSLLRNRIPVDRVYTAVGDVKLNGLGGHAWSVVKIGDIWSILDPTSKSVYIMPYHVYSAHAHFNDQQRDYARECAVCVNGRYSLRWGC